jgi:hypothetical protein
LKKCPNGRIAGVSNLLREVYDVKKQLSTVCDKVIQDRSIRGMAQNVSLPCLGQESEQPRFQAFDKALQETQERLSLTERSIERVSRRWRACGQV